MMKQRELITVFVIPEVYKDMEMLCPNCNSDDISQKRGGKYYCHRCDFVFKVFKLKEGGRYDK